MGFKEETVTRKEIELKLATIGDYVKMDFLQSCLKKQLDFDTRKFVLTKLSSIYESRKMYLESAKLIRAAADINTTFEGKLNDFIKSAQLYVAGGRFDEADISVARAIAVANAGQKVALKLKMKETYKAQAKEALQKDKRKHALEAYEKLLTMDLNPAEKKEAQTSLLSLYEKLGKINDFYSLQKIMK